MPTFNQRIQNGQILLIATIGDVGDDGDPGKPYSALLDTGAQVTSISPKIVQEAGLMAIGHTDILPVSGEPVRVFRYRVGLSIPISQGSTTLLVGAPVEVSELPFQPDNFDILLGMDFLAPFHFTMYNGMFILSN